MKSLKTLLITTTLGTTLLLAACGTQKPQQATPGTNTKTNVAEKQSAPVVKKSFSIDDGSKNMRNVLKDMKTQLSNKEEDKLIKTSEKLEVNWKLFEDDVKAKHLDLYKRVEDPLGIIQAGVKIKPIDTKTITTAIESLDEVLTEIQNVK
ncbi:hypothetical protein [Clostridium sp.]